MQETSETLTSQTSVRWSDESRCEVCGEATAYYLITDWGGKRGPLPRDCRCVREANERAERSRLAEKQAVRIREHRAAWRMDREHFARETFEAWDGARQPEMGPVFERCQHYAVMFAAARPAEGLLLLGSKNGTGKSFLLNATVNYLLDQHRLPAIAVETSELLDLVKARKQQEADPEAELMACPLLVINDPAFAHGTSYDSERAIKLLLRIIEGRILNGRPTSLSMNESPDLWGEVAGPIVRKLASRLHEACDWINIDRIAPNAVSYREVMRSDRKGTVK